jgi:hypothetical protein
MTLCLRSDAVVYGAQRIFVGFARFGGFGVGVVPMFHGDHRVVGSGERLRLKHEEVNQVERILTENLLTTWWR